MNDTIPSQAVVALATVIAALITGVIAVVNLTLAKEQKISEMRQAWIDGLRDDLAKYFSGARFVAIAADMEFRKIREKIRFIHDIPSELVAEKKAICSETLYRIKLRLNKSEAEHIELERLLERVSSVYQEGGNGDPDLLKNVLVAIQLSTDQARAVLKTEWERVKRGEEAFNNLRRWLLPAIFILMSAFVAVILMAKFS
jgi:hypothetical protein